jgi:aminoglycoside phosphotransferase (APT) family kinase protein
MTDTSQPTGVVDTSTDMDPGVAALLDRKRARVAAAGIYVPLTTEHVTGLLQGFFATERPGEQVSDVGRVGGGASKEQFAFTLTGGDGQTAKYILRMDPIQTASETDRRREFEALAAYHGVVPAPTAEWLDDEGRHFGQPAAIMGFLSGVTKPAMKSNAPNITGIGTAFAAELRGQLATQYLDCLARIHNADWRSTDMPSFHVPDADDHQVARWQLNWWSRVWREDAVQIMPIAVLTERWLRQNVPTCNDPVLVHGDYRTGNFLFDETSGTITAILDWEYAHLGDFHEDLGWMLQALYATHQDGETYVCGLYPKDEFIGEYERLSGRTVDRKTLRWYEILCAWKCLAITLATSTKAARDGHNHQDIMLSWLGPVGYVFVTELCDLIEAETAS